MTGTTDNSLINAFVGVGLFFMLMPFVMMTMAKHEHSTSKILFFVTLYLIIVAMFYTGYIYTTPVGDWIKQMERSIMR